MSNHNGIKLAKCRIAVVETLYHQEVGQKPTSTECRFSRNLNTDEQPYKRKLVIGEQWQRLDLGWAQPCGMVHLENAKRQPGTIPTEAEKEADRLRTLCVAVIHMNTVPSEEHTCTQWYVPPGETSRPGQLAEGLTLAVRCQKGQTTLILTAFPR